MKTLITIAIIGIFGIHRLSAQSLRYTTLLPYISIPNYSNQSADAFSFTANQAALARVKYAGAGLFGENKFLLASLNSYTIAAALPTRLGNFGIQLNYAGFKNYNESKIGLAYAKSLGSKLDIGIQFNYYGYRIPAYGNFSTINFEAGAIMHFTTKLSGGMHVYNPVGGKAGKKSAEKLAAVYKAGLGYDASDNFFVAAEIIKEEDKPVTVLAGIQYHFARQFFTRLGISSSTGSIFFGAGIGLSNMRVDITVSYHSQLGFSPGILLISNFKHKTK